MCQLGPLMALRLLRSITDVSVTAGIKMSVCLAIGVAVELAEAVGGLDGLLGDGDALLENTALIGLELHASIKIEE